MKIEIVRRAPFDGEDVTAHFHLNRDRQGRAEKWSIRGATCAEDRGKESRYRVLAYVDEAYLTSCRPIYQMSAVKRITREGGVREVYAKVRGTWSSRAAEVSDVRTTLVAVHLNPRRSQGLFTYGRDGAEWRGSDLVYFPNTSGTLEVS